MAIVETERQDQVMVIRMNRPERLNALGQELRQSVGRGVVRVSGQRSA